jgi:hypothetical protein
MRDFIESGLTAILMAATWWASGSVAIKYHVPEISIDQQYRITRVETTNVGEYKLVCEGIKEPHIKVNFLTTLKGHTPNDTITLNIK